jgi:hypothetical protein
MEIKVVSCTLQELLNSNNAVIPNTDIKGQLCIPEYQRPYIWKKKQLKKLVSDLNLFYNDYHPDLPLYYLGSIIIHKNEDTLNIIDGQQRLTTLALLDYHINKRQYEIEYSSPKSIRQIDENYQLLINNEIVINELNLDLLNVTLVITASEDDAYTFFETQNTGGKRLSGSDIVKAHHLRAVKGNGAIANKAMQWESKNIKSIDEVIGLLSKSRYWNYLNWKSYPSFRHATAIKNSIVEDFTEKTISTPKPISFYQTEVLESNFQQSTKRSSPLKAMRQPLYNGSHFIEYLSDYVDIYEDLFLTNNNYRIDERFYELRNKLITGNNGTVFLKELFQLLVLAFVSKFGLENLFEFSLWAFRAVYATRVINRRTVREDSIEKLVRDELFLDKILNCFTHQDAINQLKKYSYSFNSENCETNKVKGRYIMSLGNYFPAFSNGIVTENFDTTLKKAIHGKF